MHVHRAACPSPPTQHSQVLLNAFIEAFLKDEATIRDAVAQDLISKRMEDYLRLVNRWPGGMFRSTSLVRGFAGMPHGF